MKAKEREKGVKFKGEKCGTEKNKKKMRRKKLMIKMRKERLVPDPLDLKALGTDFNIIPSMHSHELRCSIAGIATGYRLDDRGVRVRVPVRLKMFSSPYRSDQLWGPSNLLSNGYRG
jgi:hypothetical protein